MPASPCLSVAAALVTLFLATACGQEPHGGTWRFALEEIEGSVQHAYATRFEQVVEQRTRGDIDVTVYPYGALGSSTQLTELVQQGAVQLAFASPGHLGSIVPEVQVFSLHFVFSENEAQNEAALRDSTRLNELLQAAYRERDLQLLSLFSEGWMVWTANRPLRTRDDFSGLKIRTMTSPLLLDVYAAYGANPTPMPYSEVYSGLQLRMIDAQVNPVFAIEEMSFYEVQDHLTFANHLPFITSVIVGTVFFDSLSPELRRLLREADSAARGFVFEHQRRLNTERLQQIRERRDVGVHRLTEAQRNAFRQASLPVRERYRQLGGPRAGQVLDALLEAVRRAETELQRSADSTSGRFPAAD